MSDLTVEMILSLVDAASPKLKAFKDALSGATAAANETAGAVDKAQASMDAAAPAMERVAAAAKVLGAGTRTTARAFLGINERLAAFIDLSRRGVPAVNQLAAAMDRLSVASKATADSLGATTTATRAAGTAFRTTFRALNNLGASADTNSAALGRLRDVLAGIAPEAEEVAGSTVAAATAVGAMGTAAEKSDKKVRGLHDGLKGLVEIYAGLKLGEGAKSSVDAASAFQTQVAQLRSLGLSGNQVRYAANQAWAQSGQTPFASVADILATRRALIAATGENNEALQNAVIPTLLKNAYTYKNLTNSQMSVSDIVKNFATLAEARGMSQTPENLIKASNQALQVAIGTQSRIKLTTQEVVARQAKYGGAQLMDKQGYFNTMGVAEQYMVAGRERGGGGGGGRGVSMVGTAVSMVLKTMLGGKMNKVTYHLMEQMGLIKPGEGAGTPGAKTTTTSMNALTHIVGSTEGMKNVWGWLVETAAPHMLAYVKAHPEMYFGKGANVNNPAAQRLALDRLAVQMFGPTGGINVGNMAFMAADPAVAARIKNSAQLMSQAKTGNAAISELNQYQLSLQKFEAAMTNLKIAMGTGLLPILTPIVTALSAFFHSLGEVAHEAPAAATAISGLGVALSGLLIYKGFVALVGSVRSVMAAFTSMAGTAKDAAATTEASTAAASAGVAASDTAMAATTEATGATMIATARAVAFGVSRWLLRAIPVVGTAILLADLVGQFKVAGVSIENWAIGLGASVVGAIDHAINWVINKVVSATIAVRNLLASAAKYTGWTSEEARLKSANASDRATLASWNASEGIRQQAFRMMAVHDTTPAGPGRAPIALPNSEQQAYEAENAAANALPPGGGGGEAMPGGKGRKSNAAKKAEEEAKKQLAAVNRLYALADRAAAKADAVVAKMNAAAQKIHLAFQAITDPLGAKIAGVNLKYGGMSSEMMKAGHPNAATEALAIGHHKVLQYQYQGAMQHLSALKGNLHQNLTGIAAQVTAGSLTKMQGSQQSIQAQKDAAPAMVQAANAALVYAKALGDPKLVQALTEQKMKLQAMGQQLGYYSGQVRNTMQSSFTGLLENIMHGQKTWGQMLYSFFASIGKGIENILAKSISQAIADSVMGKKTNQGIGSLIGGIAKWFGGLFGGSGTPATTIGATGGRASSGPGMWSMISAGGGFLKDLFSVIGSFAVGADNIPHDMVAQIHKGEMIVPAGPAAAIRSGAAAGGTQNHLHLTVHAMDSQSVMGALHAVREEAAQMFMNTAQHLNFNGG